MGFSFKIGAWIGLCGVQIMSIRANGMRFFKVEVASSGTLCCEFRHEPASLLDVFGTGTVNQTQAVQRVGVTPE